MSPPPLAGVVDQVIDHVYDDTLHKELKAALLGLHQDDLKVWGYMHV